MPCINTDGTISRSAELILLSCHTASTFEDLVREVKLPLFRIRSATRELAAAGLLEPAGDKFLTTEKGIQVLEGSAKV
jgi:predicted transcriptional regulator